MYNVHFIIPVTYRDLGLDMKGAGEEKNSSHHLTSHNSCTVDDYPLWYGTYAGTPKPLITAHISLTPQTIYDNDIYNTKEGS